MLDSVLKDCIFINQFNPCIIYGETEEPKGKKLVQGQGIVCVWGAVPSSVDSESQPEDCRVAG